MKRARLVLYSTLLLLILLASGGLAADDCETCSFSSYLVGTVDLSGKNYTTMQIINPTSKKVHLVVGFFKKDGTATGCRQADLGPNAMYEMTINSDTAETKLLDGTGGVVKIISFDMKEKMLVDGIVGFQTHHFPGGKFFLSDKITESNLATVPKKVLLDNENKELNAILNSCRP